MKNVGSLLVFCLLAAGVFAQEKNDRVEHILSLASRNLETTLKEGNDNLRESAMVVIADLKREFPGTRLSNTIIPIMSILRNHDQPGMRILAAITLRELDVEEGAFAIKEAARFDSNQTVRHICQALSPRK